MLFLRIRTACCAGAVVSSGGVAKAVPLWTRVVRNWDMGRNYASLSKPDPGHEGLRMLNGFRVRLSSVPPALSLSARCVGRHVLKPSRTW